MTTPHHASSDAALEARLKALQAPITMIVPEKQEPVPSEDELFARLARLQHTQSSNVTDADLASRYGRIFNTQAHTEPSTSPSHLLPQPHQTETDEVDALMQSMAEHVTLEGGVVTSSIHATSPPPSKTTTAHPPLDEMFSKKAMRKELAEADELLRQVQRQVKASGYRPHAASHHDPDPPSDDEDTLANEIVAEALDHARMFP